jgi:YYY domain-containing protein
LAETPFERSRPVALWRSNAGVRVRAVALSWPLALVLILVLGGALRFHGLRWDEPDGAQHPLQMHPDERFLSLVNDHLDWPVSLGQYFNTQTSPLNPYNDPDTHSFVYGTFPLFLAKGASTIAGHLPASIGPIPLPNGNADPAGTANSYDTTVIWGRRLAAVFDVATIVVVFALGWNLFTRKAGLIAALFYALAVLPTQLAHFWTMDPFLTFFTALTLLQACLFVKSKATWSTVGWGVGAGVTLGLASACKVNAALFLPVIPLAAALRILMRDYPRLGLRFKGQRTVEGNWLLDTSIVLFAIIVAFLVFRIAQPYAFEGPHFWDVGFDPRWKADLQREYDYQDGVVDYPPFVQFAARTPFLSPLLNLGVWGLGPLLGLAACLAMLAGVVILFKRRELAWALPLASAGAVFGFQGHRFVAFMRYFEPIYPVLCVAAGWGVVALWSWSRTGRIAVRWERLHFLRSPRLRPLATAAAITLLFAATAWWALAFQALYSNTNSRIAASQWIDDNIPKGAGLTYEIWDDSLPYILPNHAYDDYRGIATTPYDTDSPEKVQELIYGHPDENGTGGLINADYVVISSTRVKASVARLPAEYPATNRYYQLLDSGELGFRLVATFDSHPTFLGISLDDSHAEESFTVYDHPTVRIYKKTAAFRAANAVALLDATHPERAVNLLPKQGRTNGLEFTAAEAAIQQAGGTFTDVFSAGGLTSHVPWLWWLLFLEVSAVSAVPWVTWLFRAVPDRGYGLSKLLGLAAVVVPTWLLVAWGGPHFSGGLVWAVFALAVVTGAAIGWFRRRSLLADARSRWRTWLVVDGVFLAAFAAFLLLRYFNPDLWYNPQGGEKPMDIAYFTAVTRSTTLPPYDPWFAGGSMNYYYMGWFFLAVPVRALRIVPEIAFNLGIPTFAAFGATVAFSTVHNLVGLAARTREAASAVGGGWRRPAAFAGLFAAFLLIGMANLDGVHQTIEHLQSVNYWSLFEGTPIVGGAVGVVGGFWRWAFQGASLPAFDWWRSSRVHFDKFDITEFPFWSLLFADVHPQLMDVPFFGLVIALGVSYVATVRAQLRAQSWLLPAAIGGAVALVRMVHTWDFPTALLIGFAGIGVGQLLAGGRWQDRWWRFVAHAAIAGAVIIVPFAPYAAHFETFDPGLIRAPETTKANQYFVEFGVFVALAVAFLAVRYHEELAARSRDHGRNPFLAMVNGWLELGALVGFLAGLIAFTWPFGLTTLALAVFIELFLCNLLWLEWQQEERDIPRILGTLIYVLAFAISAGVDVVTLKNDIVRMNTVFKFYLQAWQLFALASAFAAWYVGSAVWAVRGWRIAALPGRRTAAIAGTTVIALLLAGSSIFLVAGTASRQDARFGSTGLTLDGLAFMPKGSYVETLDTPDAADDTTIHLNDDRPLIDWLRNNVKGSPVIVEAIGPLYHWTGRISEYTGLPAVIGWDWHQVQQRTDYSALVDQRRAETDRFYTSPSVPFAEQYLLKYNVSYVIVGTEEHAHASDAALAKFDTMPELTRVFESGPNAIYRVDASKLPPPALVSP